MGINIVVRIIIATSLLFMGLTLIYQTNYNNLKPIINFVHAIIQTNCKILMHNDDDSCNNVRLFIGSSIVGSSISILLVSYSFYTWIFGSINLLLLIYFMCNPWIDSSFQNINHFLQLLICAIGLLILGFENSKQYK